MVEPSDDILTQLTRRGDTRTWEAGTTVVSEGDDADCMYIIHSGELRAVLAGAVLPRWRSLHVPSSPACPKLPWRRCWPRTPAWPCS